MYTKTYHTMLFLMTPASLSSSFNFLVKSRKLWVNSLLLFERLQTSFLPKSPTIVSSKILQELKRIAEKRLRRKATEAVIAVPASFLNAQRVATEEAGKAAGFSKVHLFHEPTAAALAFGLETDVDGENVLVFDLGAATLDVSLLTVKDRNFSVLSTSGESRLGGIYFDRQIMEYAVNELRKQGKELDEIGTNVLRLACAEARKDLDSATQTSIKIESFQIPLSRDKFNTLNENLFARVIPPIENVLGSTSTEKSRVDHIVLVGGSSRTPRIIELVSRFFNGKKPNMCVSFALPCHVFFKSHCPAHL
jgi:heat shock 70kDa protein 1/2/6/8